jgi:osmotically-inducible protein OsmY
MRDGVATLRGEVDDLDDLDNALAVAGRVPGIIDVVDELALPEGQPDSRTRGSRPTPER